MYFQTKRSTNSMFFDLRTLSAAVCLVEAGDLLFELASVLIHNADRGLQLCAASTEITMLDHLQFTEVCQGSIIWLRASR